MAAFGEGSIEKCGINLVDYSPYFIIKPLDYNSEIREFNKYFEEYLTILMEASSYLNFVSQAKEFMVTTDEFADNCEKIAESANLDKKTTKKFISNLHHNIEVLKNGISKVERFKDVNL